ncbi:hypothetical protein X801_09866 [Opisthorchis viverrini]|uniref:Uncharacterized protein n=1 Tax=Opisthorchis viverrini TaxID=6198 RepID=A0A1S8WIR5_OPIVI|nr:hypothetical protein X801_09866 [Opisthorchis viverrini]
MIAFGTVIRKGIAPTGFKGRNVFMFALILREEEKNRALRYYKRSFLKVQALFQEVVVKARLDFINQSVRHLVAEEHKSGNSDGFK